MAKADSHFIRHPEIALAAPISGAFLLTRFNADIDIAYAIVASLAGHDRADMDCEDRTTVRGARQLLFEHIGNLEELRDAIFCQGRVQS